MRIWIVQKLSAKKIYPALWIWPLIDLIYFDLSNNKIVQIISYKH